MKELTVKGRCVSCGKKWKIFYRRWFPWYVQFVAWLTGERLVRKHKVKTYVVVCPSCETLIVVSW